MVPGGGVEPPWPQGPADFESAASASSAIPAWVGYCMESIAQAYVRALQSAPNRKPAAEWLEDCAPRTTFAPLDSHGVGPSRHNHFPRRFGRAFHMRPGRFECDSRATMEAIVMTTASSAVI